MTRLPAPVYAPDGRQVVPEELDEIGGGWMRLAPLLAALVELGRDVVDYDNGRYGFRPQPGGWLAYVVGGIDDEAWHHLQQRFVLPGNITRFGYHLDCGPGVEVRGSTGT